MGVGNGHEPSPNCAGVMFCSQHRCRRPSLLNTNKRQLGLIWSSQIAKQVERHHFFLLAFRCAKPTCFFDFFDSFDFSILNHMASYPSTSAHSFDILIPIVAQHDRSEAPRHVFTSGFLCRCPYIAVAPFWTYGEQILGILRSRAGACRHGHM